jgi:metal-responsive CopG/Arc/MetJ family transcriptional regulator
MNRTAKVAVSLPTGTLKTLDKTCRHQDLSRSAAVAQAVAQWLQTAATRDKDAAYVAGYIEEPEHR